MPLKSKWIHHPRKYKKEINASLIGELSSFGDKDEVAEFFELLKWKVEQHLVVWTLDEENYSIDYTEEKTEDSNKDKQSLSDPLIAPFWKYVSSILTSLVDPITGKKYHPLKDTTWWQGSYRQVSAKSAPDVHVKSVLVEMYFVTMKFKTVSEMIYQSNPSSLQPVVCYTERVYALPVNSGKPATVSIGIGSGNQHHQNHNGWWISADYDPYDLDDDE